MKFGLIIIGDEILNGRHTDAHFAFVKKALLERGLRLAWVEYIADVADEITARLQRSFSEGIPVFVTGGIGATPDDHTRQAAAKARCGDRAGAAVAGCAGRYRVRAQRANALPLGVFSRGGGFTGVCRAACAARREVGSRAGVSPRHGGGVALVALQRGCDAGSALSKRRERVAGHPARDPPLAVG